MRIISQNVTDAHLTISNQLVASIGKGLVLLVGFTFNDNEKIIDKMVDKILKMRVFKDNNGKTNLSINDIEGDILLVPQFTVYADLSDGRRPSFTKALVPNEANRLFDLLTNKIIQLFPRVKSGVFGADMQVSLTNDGPFTLLLDSQELLYE